MLTPEQEVEQLDRHRQQGLAAADQALGTIVFRVFFGVLAVGAAALIVHIVRDVSTPWLSRIVTATFFLSLVIEFGRIAIVARSFVVRHLLSGSPVYLYTKATVQAQSRLSPEDVKRRSAYLHPGRRCAARFIDYHVFAMLLCLAIPELQPVLASPWIGLSIVTAMFVPTEALLHSSCGNTLGKYLLGVSLTHDDWDRPGFGDAIRRSFLVWIYGMYCGIPYFAMFRMAKEQNQLLRDEFTSYDRDQETRVVFAEITTFKAALIAAFWVILMAGAYYTEIVLSPIPMYWGQILRTYHLK